MGYDAAPGIRYTLEHAVWKLFKINLFPLRKDRAFLEKQIFPALRNRLQDMGNVLSIGVEWHCRHYWRHFPYPMSYTTIDNDPAQGQSDLWHVNCAMEDLPVHFEYGYFSAAICNGVVGWGLNTKTQAARSFVALFDVMKKGGVLVLGYDTASRTYDVVDAVLKAGFKQTELDPLNEVEYIGDRTFFIYRFYVKP